MKEKKENIFPIFEDLLQRKDKEYLLNQNSKVIWMTGLSGSGKTTIAKKVERYLHSKKILNQLLDGDNISASFTDGILSISIPKLEPEKPKKKSVKIS